MPESRIPAISGEAFVYLDGQLTGRSKYYSPYRPRTPAVRGFGGVSRVFAKQLKHGECESCGFTGACLGTAQQVFSIKDDRYSLFLDRRGGSIPFIIQSL